MLSPTPKHFLLGIVLPSVLAIVLFIVSLYAIFLPAFERSILNGKKEMISELTNTVWSLIQEHEKSYVEEKLSLEEAQENALKRVGKIRYGARQKDYFWIIDSKPSMIMHPYRKDLIGQNLENYVDPEGKKIFANAVQLVKSEEQGFIDYFWQWKDDPTQVVSKLSHVKYFEPWGWVIGTGMYLDDVEEEIASVESSLLRVILIICSGISIIILYVVRQSHLIEEKRAQLTNELIESRKKYETLVEASNQGLLMFIDGSLVFANSVFYEMSGYGREEVLNKTTEDIFSITWSGVKKWMAKSPESASLELELNCASGKTKKTIVHIAKVKYSSRDGTIFSVREISDQVLLAQENKKLAGELQTSLLLMEQAIRPCIREILTCESSKSIRDAAKYLARKRESCLFVTQGGQIIGIVTPKDFTARGFDYDIDQQGSIVRIMTAPVEAIRDEALLYEAVLRFHNKKISYLATVDRNHSISGVISFRDITAMQQNTMSYLIHEIEVAERVDDLVSIHKKVPSIVLALVDSGDNISNITSMISSISDAFISRIIELGLEELGDPPCDFAFIVMGSEGRMEQTLLTDQDNAIIFESVEGNQREIAQDFFLRLGDYICYSLDEVGYNYCKGGIMACNEKWNKPLSVWKEYFNKWMSSCDSESIVDASVFFDFKGVYGSRSLAKSLRSFVSERVKSKERFLSEMAGSVKNYKSPVGMLGQLVGNEIKSKNKDVDIKLVLMPVIKFARLFSLLEGVEETNTLNRLRCLKDGNVITAEVYDSLVLSYNYLMNLRFRVQARALINGNSPENKISIESLTRIEVATLKKVFAEIDEIPALVRHV